MANFIFSTANTLSFLAWLFLIIFPNGKYTQTILTSGWIVLLSIVYTFLIGSGISNFSPDSFGSIASVRSLFQDDIALTAGWVHYLAFDLMIGCLIVRQSIAQNIPRWLYSICLPFTFMFGPVGYLLYKIISLKYANHQGNLQ